MTIELIKQLMDTCYLAKRARDLLPPLPPVRTTSRSQTQSVPSEPLKNSIRSCVKGETSMKSDKSDFTQGSILQKLVLFMLPVLGALVLQAAYGAVDLLVVGHFGSTSGLSAVSTGSQVLNLVTFVVTQFAMGITVLIARYLGEKRPQYIGQVIGGSIVVFALIPDVQTAIRYTQRSESRTCQLRSSGRFSCHTLAGICAGRSLHARPGHL